ncbi:hypothetical protein LOK49_LG14G00349 [Camellia lanceoleosa]|uniref:Uncharacterized protein n=1 Tax=Camellia lanceoleosa TaxID=1840588 RepID=A0ACC0FD13_9ERIC|nr:hypothetical protein LOK49_LG14G00349 [Camellia lanceoleosa]
MPTTTPMPSIAITHPFSNLHNHCHRYGGQESSGRHWKVKETERMKEKNREDKVQKWETRCKSMCRVVWGASHVYVECKLLVDRLILSETKIKGDGKDGIGVDGGWRRGTMVMMGEGVMVNIGK